MANLDELRSAIKARWKETNEELDSLIDSYINQAIRMIGRMRPWKQLLVEDYEITTVAGTERYILPVNFFRTVKDSARYDVTDTDQGRRLIEVNNKDFESYKLLNEATSPVVYSIVGVQSGDSPTTTSRKWIQFAPSFTDDDLVVQIDYHRNPTDLTDGDTEMDMPECFDWVVYESLKQLAAYHSNMEMIGYFSGEVRVHKNIALQAIVNG